MRKKRNKPHVQHKDKSTAMWLHGASESTQCGSKTYNPKKMFFSFVKGFSKRHTEQLEEN